MWGKIAWRLFWRELSRGELWVIAFSLFLAVLTVVSLSGITESVRSALYQRSANFVAADKILRSSVGFNEQVQQQATALELKSSRQVQFNSMLFAKDLMQLVSVKAVSATYPLRGELKLSSSVTDATVAASLQPNQLYLESRLYSLLDIQVGDSLELGEKVFTAAGVIVAEPDAPLSVFGSSPRVLMHLDDVAVDFPDMPIILAHPSFPWQEEALAVAQHKPNVYIDLSGWSPKYFPPILVRYANSILKHRMLFGSDWPMITPERWLNDFEKLDIKPDVRPLILKENAAKLLGLS